MLDDKDEFRRGGETYNLKNFLWGHIKSHAQAQGLNWREMADRLRELAYDAEMEAEKEEADPDEIMPVDLPQRPQ